MKGYSAYILAEDKRKALLDIFEPRFSKPIAHHITYEFGVPMPPSMPKINTLEITHIISDGYGIEIICVKINGNAYSPDGRRYHITWSLEDNKALPPLLQQRDKDAETYKPKHANDVIDIAFGGNCPEEYEITALNIPISEGHFTAVYIEDNKKQTHHVIPVNNCSPINKYAESKTINKSTKPVPPQ